MFGRVGAPCRYVEETESGLLAHSAEIVFDYNTADGKVDILLKRINAEQGTFSTEYMTGVIYSGSDAPGKWTYPTAS